MRLEAESLEVLIKTTTKILRRLFSKKRHRATVSCRRERYHLIFDISIPSIEFEYTLTLYLTRPQPKWVVFCWPIMRRNYGVTLNMIGLREIARYL